MRTATLLPMLEISYTPEEEDGQGCLPEGVIQADRQALDKNERELSEVERKEITDKIYKELIEALKKKMQQKP